MLNATTLKCEELIPRKYVYQTAMYFETVLPALPLPSVPWGEWHRAPPGIWTFVIGFLSTKRPFYSTETCGHTSVAGFSSFTVKYHVQKIQTYTASWTSELLFHESHQFDSKGIVAQNFNKMKCSVNYMAYSTLRLARNATLSLEVTQ